MPTLHLVVDDLVPVDKFQFQVRMWRQAGFPPIVLSSQVRGHPPPHWYSGRLANLVITSFLGYELPIPVFFELSKWCETTRAFRVRFDTIGCNLRPILHKPKHTPLKPSAVEQLFGVKLDSLIWLKIGIHLCDMPGGHLDPDNPMSEMMIGILIVFVKYERRLISVRTREGLQARKQRGERYCRWAEYGWAWVKQHDPALGKDVNVKMADEGERIIMAKCVELRAAGYSLHKIRQHLNFEMKARTRVGGHWTTSRVAVLVQQGLRFMAENVTRTTELLAAVDEEEDYEIIVVLEDEIDD